MRASLSTDLGSKGVSRRAIVLGAVTCAIAATAPTVLVGKATAKDPELVAPITDHHIHLGTPALADQIEAINKEDPTAFQFLSKDIFTRPRPVDALRILDEAGVKRAVVLSTAYMFVPSGPLPDPAKAFRSMREENRFIVRTALASRGRFIAFVAINPFAANAHDEFTYWKGKPGVGGIKLHLGGAGFHASNPEQVAILARFFARARNAHLPLLVHLRGGGAFPKSEVETFIDKVLSQAGDLSVQIAHGGGYAGADPATIDSLTAFGDAIARRAPGTKNLVFDISGVVLPEDTAKALGSSDAQLKIFVELMRKIGLDRFVIGSDWPALGRIAPYYALMRQKLPLTDAEWARLCRNEAPYLRRAR